jgi:hypothetical protein
VSETCAPVSRYVTDEDSDAENERIALTVTADYRSASKRQRTIGFRNGCTSIRINGSWQDRP